MRGNYERQFQESESEKEMARRSFHWRELPQRDYDLGGFFIPRKEAHVEKTARARG